MLITNHLVIGLVSTLFLVEYNAASSDSCKFGSKAQEDFKADKVLNNFLPSEYG